MTCEGNVFILVHIGIFIDSLNITVQDDVNEQVWLNLMSLFNMAYTNIYASVECRNFCKLHSC